MNVSKAERLKSVSLNAKCSNSSNPDLNGGIVEKQVEIDITKCFMPLHLCIMSYCQIYTGHTCCIERF